MKLHGLKSVTRILPIFARIFPRLMLKEMSREFLPEGNYYRQASPGQVVLAILKAVLLQLPNQRQILTQHTELGLACPSSLSYNLRQPWMVGFATEMQQHLEMLHPHVEPAAVENPRLLIDTMPAMLPITQRGTCTRFNNVAKGCGVMCTFNLDATSQQCPVRILKIMHGPWNDTFQVRGVVLDSNGPIYIADRGFYSRVTVEFWVTNKVHFIARGKKQRLHWSQVRQLIKSPTTLGSVRVETDEIVLLGKDNGKPRCQVRMLRGWLESGEDLILITDQFELTTEQLLDMYLKRGQIEVYHRFLKQSLGLAHLYSFDQTGIEGQIRLSALLANLLYLAAAPHQNTPAEVLKIISTSLEDIRRELGLWKPWKRNTYSPTRKKAKRKRRYLKPATSGACLT
jgi:hypothetical protein